MYILRTGRPWKSLPRTFGSASAIHRHFDAWQAAGLFITIWKAGLAEHEELEGIAWQWNRNDNLRLSLINADPSVSFSRAKSKQERFNATPNSRRIWQPSHARRRQRKKHSS